MKIGSAFPSQYLKADDLGNARPVVTIDRVELEEVGGEPKPILYFLKKDKGLVLNKTNANAITGMTGTDETDAWKGQKVCLYVTKVDFQGKRVNAIRIEDPPNGGQVKPPPPPPPESFLDADDDSVPF